jgi:hypothetical protein
MSDDYLEREARISIECDMCGRQFEHSVRWIHTHGSAICPHCGCTVDKDVCLHALGQEDETGGPLEDHFA